MHRADEVSIYNKYIAPINIMTKYAYYIYYGYTKPIYAYSMQKGDIDCKYIQRIRLVNAQNFTSLFLLYISPPIDDIIIGRK